MDFFESQELARRNTKLLIGLFALAILVLVLLTELLVLLLANYFAAFGFGGLRYFEGETFLFVALFVVSTIIIGSLSRVASLSRGGTAVAETLDGKLLVEGQDFKTRQLLNIVEEMSIASGTPVPQVFLIPDSSINAFAAGYTPGDAVIGVTRGALDSLAREELQGVIAHEFSHILNGDMRLNIQMMGTLYGIYMLSVVGRMIGAPGTSDRKRSSGSISLIGFGLFAVGYLGQLAGRLIKAAVSRQREYLADASAVQFTRNPDGIAGALKRIGGYPLAQVMTNPKSEEVSHAFFSLGISIKFATLFSTHPPIAERIIRLQPSWDGKFLETSVDVLAESDAEHPVSGFSAPTAESLMASVGQAPEIEVARELIAGIPAALWAGVHEPYTARAVTYLLLLDGADEVREKQLTHLQNNADFGVHNMLRKLLPYYPVDHRRRLPLLEMALPSLRQLSADQYSLFRNNLDALIRADDRISITEWALRKFVSHHLDAFFRGDHNNPRYRRLSQVAGHCAVLLSMLAYSGPQQKLTREQVFAKGKAALDLDIRLIDRARINLSRLDVSVDALAQLAPLRKPKLLKACIAVIVANGVVTPVEEQLVGTVASILDCPMPPIPMHN